jgi:hypothetical protein
MVNEILSELSPELAPLYSKHGRQSIPSNAATLAVYAAAFPQPSHSGRIYLT